MFNFFKKKTINKNIEIDVQGVNPETDNEFLFFEFVRTTSDYLLEPWMKKAKMSGFIFKPQYELAINQKLSNGIFENPHKFPEYFLNTFDYIAIDFETANNNRLSACAIGLNFVKSNKIVHSKKHYILPPKGEQFIQTHTNIHGITKEDVKYACNFKELWEQEFSKYFNNNLIIFHNASMDLSVLKNLYEHYEIKPFVISYIDTMSFADKLGLPKRITELAKSFNIEIKKHHDPEADAEVCSLIFGELIDRFPNYKELIRTIDSKESPKNIFNKIASEDIIHENSNCITKFSITKEELENLIIATKGFVVTGNFDMDREVISDFLMRQGGQMKSGISSKVNYVIAGEECDWLKIQKVNEINNTKSEKIKILTNSDLKYLMKKYGK